MSWLDRVRTPEARPDQGGPRGPQQPWGAGVRGRLREAELERGLRRALGGEVAGATPRADAWVRLEQRLPPLRGYAPAGGRAPGWDYAHWDQTWLLTARPLTRFSQLGVALLLLALVLSNGVALHLGGPTARTLTAPAAGTPFTGSAMRPPSYVNRATWLIAHDPASPIADPAPPDRGADAAGGLGAPNAGPAGLDRGGPGLRRPPAETASPLSSARIPR
ncbi:MAG TPA: hypothetical protein VKY74_06370 [Chloroflexia bacterium]|nr:hypothetical protein [Chloroflexia bacterium]